MYRNLSKEFDALFLGCGLERSLRLNVPGDHLVGDGLKWLSRIRTGASSDIVGDAVVIGGGNTAVDLSRSLIRKGASKVTIVYRRRLEDMPAFPKEIERAVEEGIRIVTLTSPARIESGEKKKKIITLQKMKPSTKSENGRTRVVPISST